MTLHSFDKLHHALQQREDLRNTLENGGIERVTPRGRGIQPGDDDPGWDVVNLNRGMQVIAVEEGQFIINVRGQGNLLATGHAVGQLGGLMGVRMPKFFQGMDPNQINTCIRYHLKAQNKPVYRRVISRRHGESKIALGMDSDITHEDEKRELADTATDGVLRAFVSPTYAEIKDVRVFDRIKQVADAGRLREQAIAMFGFRDNGSHFMMVDREPVDVMAAGKWKGSRTAGTIGEACFFGVRMRNSEVGSHALSAHPYFVRFVCSNGIIVGVREEPLLYRQHRDLSDTELDRMLGEMYASLDERTQTIIDNTRRLHDTSFEDPESEIKLFLRREPKSLREAVLHAYSEEPVPTAYGVMQAIARAAMASRRDMDRQFDIEQLAGRYMHTTLKRIS